MHTALAKVLGILADSEPTEPKVSLAVSAVLSAPAAHFVADETITHLIGFDSIQKGFLAMAHAEVLALPFDPILIEFKDPTRPGWNFVRLGSKPVCPPDSSFDIGYDIYAYPVSVVPDTRPSNLGGFIMATVAPDDPVVVDLGKAGADIPYTVHVSRHKDPDTNKAKEQLGIDVAEAMSIAFLMLNTKGIDKVHVDTGKFNKARLKHGKVPLRPYSVLRIGTIYDRQGNAHSVTGSGRHMPVHWRCGHVRQQRYGKGLTESRQIFIPPCLVNYDPALSPDKVPLPHKEVTL